MHPTGPDPLAALATEVGALGRRLDHIGTELLALTAQRAEATGAPAPAGAPAPGPAGGWPAAPAPPAAWPQQPPPWPQQPSAAWPQQPSAAWPQQPPAAWPQQPPAAWPQQPSAPPWAQPPVAEAAEAAPPTPRRPRRSAMSGARLLAWTGAAVTLLGVVMLLVLAARRGWFGPEARVVAGGLLGVALVGIAMRLHRRESSVVGALALAATGFATLYLVDAGATRVLGLPTAVAVVLALVVAGAGLGLAARWSSQLLAGGIVVGAALLAPWLVEGWRLVAFVLALQVAAAPVVLRLRWAVLALVAAFGPVVYGAFVATSDSQQPPATIVLTTLAVLLVGLGTAALATRRLTGRPVAALVASAPLPVLAAVPLLGRGSGTALAVGAALALLAVAALPGAQRVVRQVAIAAAAVAVFQATAVAFDGSTRTAVLLGQGTVLAVLAAVLRSRLPLAIAGAYGLAGVAAALVQDAPLVALVEPVAPYLVDGRPVVAALVPGLIVSVLVLALAIALVAAAGRLGLVRPDAGTAWLWVPVGLVGLYGAAGAVITAALLVARAPAGFTAGHALVTVSWTLGALVLLARGISRPALRITGLALVAAAVAKLVLFDLGALDGLAQVAAFLGAGLVILAAGTRYARLVAEAEAAAAAAAAADGPAANGPAGGDATHGVATGGSAEGGPAEGATGSGVE